jgi:hypothetical protein
MVLPKLYTAAAGLSSAKSVPTTCFEFHSKILVEREKLIANAT